MKSFFDPSPPLLCPTDIVLALTQKTPQELSLPTRAIVVFNTGDARRLLTKERIKPIEAWSKLRCLYRVEPGNTVVTRSGFGGANIAALVEELSSFGVQEFVLWGHCGAIDERIAIGDIIIGKGALREDGVSYHYLKDTDAFVYTDWYNYWKDCASDWYFREGLIWSCEAIYRETRTKVLKYRRMGISAVEMELASLYSVCKSRGLKGIAFLVTSDRFIDTKWTNGFSSQAFRRGVEKLTNFMREMVIPL